MKKSTSLGIFAVPGTLADSKIVMIPVPWDVTTSYGKGTAQGPQALFQASGQVDLFDGPTGRNLDTGYFMLPESKKLSALNRKWSKVVKATHQRERPLSQKTVAEINKACGVMSDWVFEKAQSILTSGKIPAVIGGDHSTPFGNIKAVAATHPKMGILHIDAHADLRLAYQGFQQSHASIMRNVMEQLPVKKLVQVGIRDFCQEESDYIRSSGGRISTFFDADIQASLLGGDGGKGVSESGGKNGESGGRSWREICEKIWSQLPQEVYISFDIDGLDPALCPNTGTPVPGGLSWAQAIFLIRGVRSSGRRIVGFDLNEVAPDPTGSSEWDANVGARILFNLIAATL